MAERVGSDGELDDRVEDPADGTFGDHVQQRPDRRAAGSSPTERREVAQPQQVARGGVDHGQVERAIKREDLRAQQRIGPGVLIGDSVAVTPPDRAESCVEIRRRRSGGGDREIAGQGPAQPVQESVPVDGNERVRQVDVHHLPSRVHTGVGTAGADQPNRCAEPQHPLQPELQFSLDGAKTGLYGPAGKAAAVVADVEPPADQPTHGSDPSIGQIEDSAAGVESALLESGDRPRRPARGPAAVLVTEPGVMIQHVPHLSGVVLPVGGQAPTGTRLRAGTRPGRRRRETGSGACGA